MNKCSKCFSHCSMQIPAFQEVPKVLPSKLQIPRQLNPESMNVSVFQQNQVARSIATPPISYPTALLPKKYNLMLSCDPLCSLKEPFWCVQWLWKMIVKDNSKSTYCNIHICQRGSMDITWRPYGTWVSNYNSHIIFQLLIKDH